MDASYPPCVLIQSSKYRRRASGFLSHSRSSRVQLTTLRPTLNHTHTHTTKENSSTLKKGARKRARKHRRVFTFFKKLCAPSCVCLLSDNLFSWFRPIGGRKRKTKDGYCLCKWLYRYTYAQLAPYYRHVLFLSPPFFLCFSVSWIESWWSRRSADGKRLMMMRRGS